jgi:hypothetical protein
MCIWSLKSKRSLPGAVHVTASEIYLSRSSFILKIKAAEIVPSGKIKKLFSDIQAHP